MDKYDQYEQDGRILFKSILDQCNITDQHPSTEKYDTLDYYYSSPKKDGLAGVEIKVRDTKFLNYSTLVMEVSKFKANVARLQSKELDRAYYVNFIGCDTAYIFNLRDIIRAGIDGKIQQGYMYAPKTTAEYSDKVLKKVLYLPKEIGLKLTRVGDKWIKTH